MIAKWQPKNRTGHMSDDTTNDENGYRQGSEERKGAL